MWSEKVVSVDDEEVGVVVAHASDVEICDGEHVGDHGSVSLGTPDGVFFVGAFWRNRRGFLDLGHCFDCDARRDGSSCGSDSGTESRLDLKR